MQLQPQVLIQGGFAIDGESINSRANLTCGIRQLLRTEVLSKAEPFDEWDSAGFGAGARVAVFSSGGAIVPRFATYSV